MVGFFQEKCRLFAGSWFFDNPFFQEGVESLYWQVTKSIAALEIARQFKVTLTIYVLRIPVITTHYLGKIMTKSPLKPMLALCVAYFLAVETTFAVVVPTVLWTRTQSTGAWNGYAHSAAIDGDGNVFVVGSSDGKAFGTGTTGNKAYVAKYSPTGTLLWNHVWQDWQASSGIAVDDSGSAFVSLGGYVAKFSSSGTILWDRYISGTWEGITVDPLGNLYLPCMPNFSSGPGVIKLNSEGQTVWSSANASGLSGIPRTIAVDAAGNTVITGTEWSTPSGACGYAAKFDAAGNLAWKKQYGGVNTSNSVGSAVIDDSGEVFVSVKGPLFGQSGSFLLKYDSAGNLLDHNLFSDASGHASMALDPQGAIYLTGGPGLMKFDLSTNLIESYLWYCDHPRLAYGNNHLIVAGMKQDSSYSFFVSNLLVPEPSSVVLLGLAGLSLAPLARRRFAAFWRHSKKLENA